MWEIDLANQTTSFLLSAALGVILCIIYDVFRSYRKVKLPSVIAVFVQDVVFFALSAVLTFLLLIATTKGQIRAYVFLGIIIGFAVCRISLSIIIFKVLVWLFKKCKSLLRLINGIFSRCFLFLCDKFKVLLNKTVEIFKNMFFSCKKLLHKTKA